MNGSTPKSPEEWRAERRRARWNAFLTPFITLASIVVSVGMVMYMLKSCSGRFPKMP